MFLGYDGVAADSHFLAEGTWILHHYSDNFIVATEKITRHIKYIFTIKMHINFLFFFVVILHYLTALQNREKWYEQDEYNFNFVPN